VLIHNLMHEAENERVHVMTFIQPAKATGVEPVLVLIAQWIFFIG